MPSTAVPLYTPEDLLKMPDGDKFELVDGRLVERSMGFRSPHVAGRLLFLVGQFDPEQELGWAFPADAGYRCFPNNRLRRPDFSFVCIDRLSDDRTADGYITFAPDLAVEVISPNDVHYETDRKVQEYLDAGARLVWVLNPDVRTALVYRKDGSIAGLREPGELDGEDVLPGFRCPLASLFKTPRAR